jgi:hypothetical protein
VGCDVCTSLANRLHSRLAKANVKPEGKQDVVRKLFQCAARDFVDKRREVYRHCPLLILSVDVVRGFPPACITYITCIFLTV